MVRVLGFFFFSSHRLLTHLVYLVPIPHDPRPGRFVLPPRFQPFSYHRNAVAWSEEGVNSRFVTGDRVESILKVSSNVPLSRESISDSEVS